MGMGTGRSAKGGRGMRTKSHYKRLHFNNKMHQNVWLSGSAYRPVYGAKRTPESNHKSHGQPEKGTLPIFPSRGKGCLTAGSRERKGNGTERKGNEVRDGEEAGEFI